VRNKQNIKVVVNPTHIYTHVLILQSINAPPMGARPPTDVCCVVDVSGSMGSECTNGDSESQGLSVLAVVKHACKTVVHSLTPEDRFCLVSYSTNAKVMICSELPVLCPTFVIALRELDP
jgi:hypothetical protein